MTRVIYVAYSTKIVILNKVKNLCLLGIFTLYALSGLYVIICNYFNTFLPLIM